MRLPAAFDRFQKIYAVDYEFEAPQSEPPSPVCMVAKELRSGETIRVWRGELLKLKDCPLSLGSDALYIAYYASAEMGCHLALGWKCPENILDLFTEFRVHTNGRAVPWNPMQTWKAGLLDALLYFGIDAIEHTEKEQMRNLVLRGGPWSDRERVSILDYCESDVVSLEKLLSSMAPSIDVDRALLRGRYMRVVAEEEFNGIPMDVARLNRLKENWAAMREEFIRRVDRQYGVFENGQFKRALFAAYIERTGIAWPTLASGNLALDDDTFRDMAARHPELEQLRQLRKVLSKTKAMLPMVGVDGRSRTMLSAFRSITGRNQPSNATYPFGMASWLRGLIAPSKGHALAYIDYSQQEFGIAAALSHDELMMAAYQTGDPYLAFAKQAGAVPPGGTKDTHPNERKLFKACCLAVQYGMGPKQLAENIGQSVGKAADLLSAHRHTYAKFWRWQQAALDFASCNGYLPATFGWRIHLGPKTKQLTLGNFPMQANGAEMLRLASCFAHDAGVRICAPVHDALLIEAPEAEIAEAVDLTQRAMAKASAIVLDGFTLLTDARIIYHPNNFLDGEDDLKAAREMWDLAWEVIGDLCRQATDSMHPCIPGPSTIISSSLE